MTTLESTDLKLAHECFDAARNRVTEATAGLSEAQWHFKPSADRWSVAENLEHMVIVQERVIGRILQQLALGPAPAADRNSEEIDAIVIEKIPDRSITAQAPEFIRPSGKLPPAEALERFRANYLRLIELARTTPDLRAHVLDAPPLRVVTNGAFTSMDGFQWILTVSRHDERHVRQILEVKASANYPA